MGSKPRKPKRTPFEKMERARELFLQAAELCKETLEAARTKHDYGKRAYGMLSIAAERAERDADKGCDLLCDVIDDTMPNTGFEAID